MLCVLGNEDDLYAIGYKHILFEKEGNCQHHFESH